MVARVENHPDAPQAHIARNEPSPLRQKIARIAQGVFSCCNRVYQGTVSAIQTCKPMFNLGAGSVLVCLGLYDTSMGLYQIGKGIIDSEARFLGLGEMNLAVGVIQVLSGVKCYQPDQTEIIRSQFNSAEFDQAKWGTWGGLLGIYPGIIAYQQLDSILPPFISEVQQIALEAIAQTATSVLFGGVGALALILMGRTITYLDLRIQDCYPQVDEP